QGQGRLVDRPAVEGFDAGGLDDGSRQRARQRPAGAYSARAKARATNLRIPNNQLQSGYTKKHPPAKGKVFSP
ncbi:MAG: hypothetical protein M1598_06740, partial [Actinobacteria bacterium]|nr:hypothetical protein [Actinomycetota bacterium]